MKLKLSLLVLLSLPLLSRAQGGATGSAQQTAELARGMTDVFTGGFDIVSYDLRGKDIRGNAFLVPYWTPGEILLTGNRKSIQVPIKYDLYRQQLRVRRPQGDSILVPVNQVKEFRLMGYTSTGAPQSRRFVRYDETATPTDVLGTCGEVLSEGTNVQLVKFWRKNVVKVQESTTNMALQNTVKEFHDNVRYYLRWNDGHMTEVRPKRSSLQHAFANQPAALQEIKTKRLPIDSETQLAAAVLALDPLLTAAAR